MNERNYKLVRIIASVEDLEQLCIETQCANELRGKLVIVREEIFFSGLAYIVIGCKLGLTIRRDMYIEV